MMPTTTLANSALGAYLGLACGDALGATVEFMSPKLIRERYGVHRDIVGGGWLGLEAGQVTDDTQMALALGQALIERQGWHLPSVANAFVDWMHGNPPDIGNTCRRGITRYRDRGELSGPPRDDEAGNGACMRNLPVVLASLGQREHFTEWTLQQCHITHNNPLSDAATLALGRMVQSLIVDADRAACMTEAEGLIARYSPFGFTPYPGKASGYIVDTVQTVLHYFFTTDDFESCLIGTVNQGGDADTTGALAGMLAGAAYGVEGIPKRWLDSLDQTIYKRIEEQTEALFKLCASDENMQSFR